MNGVGYGITPFMGASGILARSSGGGGVPFVNTYSMSFDGVDEWFNVGTSSLGITNAITVSAWVKIPTTNTGGPSNRQQIICEDTTTAGQRNWNLLWRGTGFNYFQWVVWHTDLSATSITSTGVVPNDGFWHHVMGTYDGTSGANGMKLYIDGVLNAQGTAGSTGINSFTSTEPTIGKLTTSNDRYFEGNIDEVAIWNSDQSSNVSTIYNGGAPTDLTSLSPLSWWRMGDGDTWGGSSWTLTDNGSGGNDATSVNMEEADRLPISPSSFSLNSFSFDGVDEYFAISNPTSFTDTGDFSISAWVNFTLNSATATNALNIRDDRYLYIQSGKIIGAFKNSSGTFYSISTSLTYNDGNWHHVLFVKNSTNMILFVDGTQVTINSNGGLTRSGGTSFARIGARAFVATPSNYFNGAIDEMAYFTSDQSSNISTIFNNGVPQDISSLSPLSHWRMGENATWNGSTWTLTDQGSGGNNATSVNMEEADKTGDQAYVL